MSVAFGTSTPTSTTVVAISAWIVPVAKPSITRCFSSAFSRPWSKPSRRGGGARMRGKALAPALGGGVRVSRPTPDPRPHAERLPPRRQPTRHEPNPLRELPLARHARHHAAAARRPRPDRAHLEVAI